MNRRDFLRLIGVSTAVVGAGIGVSACSSDDDAATGGAGGADADAKDTTVRVAALGSPSDELDPAAATSTATWVGIYAIFESLVAIIDGEPVNQLAARCEPDDSAKVWTIALREDATFSDGSPVTASDVIDSVSYTAGSPLAGSSLAPIDFAASKEVDDKTVELHLSQPRADFVENVLALQSCVYKGGDPAAGIGSGPFVLKSGSAADGWVFTPNEYYPDTTFGGLEVRPVADPAARASAVESGETDYACDLPITAARQVREPARVVNGGAVDAKVYGLILNTKVAPFDDVKVRHAFKLLIDRSALVDAVLGDGAMVGDDILGKGLPGYPEDLDEVSRDADAARKILSEAGVEDLTLVTADVVPGMNDAADMIAKQCEEAGLKISLDRRDPAAYFADMAALMKLPLFATYMVNRSTSSALHFTTGSNGGFNLDGFGTEGDWDKRLAEMSAETDEDERQQAVDKLAHEVAEDGGQLLWGFQPFLNLTTDTVGETPTSQSAPVFGSTTEK